MNIPTETIQSMGLLITVSYGYPDPKVKDPHAKAAVMERFGNDEGSGDFQKKLFSDETRKPFVRLKGDIFQRYIYKELLPWSKGVYLVPPHSVNAVSSKLNSFKTLFNKYLGEFENLYHERKAYAKVSHGALYKESEFPSLYALKERFHFDWEWQRLPADARNCPHAHLVQHMHDHMENKIKESVTAPIKTLIGASTKLVQTLIDNKSGWQSSNLNNVIKSLECMPSLAKLIGDPEIETIAGNLTLTLNGLTAEQLKTDELTRSVVTAVTKDSVDQLLSKLGAL